MRRQEFRRKAAEKKAKIQQRKWIRSYIRGRRWLKRRKLLICTVSGVFFIGWIVLWLYEGAGKKATTTETYLLPKEQQEDFYPGKSIELFGIQIRIHEGNITFFREKHEAKMEEY